MVWCVLAACLFLYAHIHLSSSVVLRIKCSHLIFFVSLSCFSFVQTCMKKRPRLTYEQRAAEQNKWEQKVASALFFFVCFCFCHCLFCVSLFVFNFVCVLRPDNYLALFRPQQLLPPPVPPLPRQLPCSPRVLFLSHIVHPCGRSQKSIV